MARATRGPDGRFTGAIGSGKRSVPTAAPAVPASTEAPACAAGEALGSLYAAFAQRDSASTPLTPSPVVADLLNYPEAHRLWEAENGLDGYRTDPIETTLHMFGLGDEVKDRADDVPAFMASVDDARREVPPALMVTTRADWDPESGTYVIRREWNDGRRWRQEALGVAADAREAYLMTRQAGGHDARAVREFLPYHADWHRQRDVVTSNGTVSVPSVRLDFETGEPIMSVRLSPSDGRSEYKAVIAVAPDRVAGEQAFVVALLPPREPYRSLGTATAWRVSSVDEALRLVRQRGLLIR